MLLTLFMNLLVKLNAIIFAAIMFVQVIAFAIMDQLNAPIPSIWEIVGANVGMGGLLFVIWHLTFKKAQKQFEKSLDQNQSQFAFALSQNQKQFEMALSQIDKQHKENLEQNQKTIDRMLEHMRQENVQKQILTGILTRMETALSYHTKTLSGD